MVDSHDTDCKTLAYARWCTNVVASELARHLGDEACAARLESLETSADLTVTVRSLLDDCKWSTLHDQRRRDHDDPLFAWTRSALQLLELVSDIDSRVRWELASHRGLEGWTNGFGYHQIRLSDLVLGRRPGLDRGMFPGSQIELVCLLHAEMHGQRQVLPADRFGEAFELAMADPATAEVVLSVMGAVGLERARDVARATLA